MASLFLMMQRSSFMYCKYWVLIQKTINPTLWLFNHLNDSTINRKHLLCTQNVILKLLLAYKMIYTFKIALIICLHVFDIVWSTSVSLDNLVILMCPKFNEKSNGHVICFKCIPIAFACKKKKKISSEILSNNCWCDY